ncbi:MAG TPA: hypothetical protein VLT16_17565, partial [Candidatus Limnocylindrales bacterium]|nr:hypothetical protein [Candidatus Limnocylindrales bacterium]
QGRALQVGSEILSRLQEPIEVKPSKPTSQIRMTYKLAPRTVRLINQLAETAYQSSGQVLAACMQALKLKDLSLGKKGAARGLKKSAG